MTLQLYAHPLASFCWKALIALYENGTPFEPVLVDHRSAESRAAFEKISLLSKMPALVDTARGKTVLESTIVVEYLDAFYPGPSKLIPADPDDAWRVRMWNSFFDSYLHHPMQKIVGDFFRPEDGHDALGVAEAEDNIRKAYAALEPQLAGKDFASKPWMIGDAFTLADCAAVPALIYCDCVAPLGESEPNIAAYLDRLRARPSVHRTLKEAEPHFKNFPIARKPKI